MRSSWLFLTCAILTSAARLGERCGKCSKKAQLSQASLFCSSFESIGVQTITQYPSTTTKPNDCCPQCAAENLPAAPATSSPTTTPPTTTPSITKPACLGSATGLSQASKACACLSLTSKTTTVTAATPLTLTGPFHAYDPDYDVYLTDVSSKGVTLIHLANETLASNYYLDQNGRLFSRGDFNTPFSLPENSPAGSINPVNKQNKAVPPTLEEPLACAIMPFGCGLECSATGYVTGSYSDCHTTWNLQRETATAVSTAQSESCRFLGLMAPPTGE